eukprot:scaffold401_cov399-Prasinococcus_capsulatus_cf.AAC.7
MLHQAHWPEGSGSTLQVRTTRGRSEEILPNVDDRQASTRSQALQSETPGETSRTHQINYIRHARMPLCIWMPKVRPQPLFPVACCRRNANRAVSDRGEGWGAAVSPCHMHNRSIAGLARSVRLPLPSSRTGSHWKTG